ncbi:MAG: HAD-IB family hydrolase [Gammaproteobacteria bacterium]
MFSKRLAIFDLDNTILDGDSDFGFINFLIEENILSDSYRDTNQRYMDAYLNGTLEMEDWGKFSLVFYDQKTAEDIKQTMDRFFKKVFEPLINIFALRRIHHHHENNDYLLLATATNEIIAKLAAKRLGFNDYIATKIVRNREGCYTNKIEFPPAFKEGKLAHLLKWIGDNHWVGNETLFYSDSVNDLPLLEYVTHPIATNPDSNLREIATQRGWEILDFPRI